MNRHAWRELRRQIRESGAAGLVAVMLVTLASALSGVLWAARNWVDAQILPGERPATVVAVVQPVTAVEAAWAAARQRFAAIGGGPVPPGLVRTQLADWFPEFASLFAGLADESFPALLDVEVAPDVEPALVEWLRAQPQVVLVESSRGWQERLDRAAWKILWSGFAVALTLLAGCGALVLLVVRLLVLDHADEIAIMRLIGAHESEIRLPYLMCGIVLGCAGGALGSVILLAALWWARTAFPGVELSTAFLAALPVVGGGAGLLGAGFGLASLPSEP